MYEKLIDFIKKQKEGRFYPPPTDKNYLEFINKCCAIVDAGEDLRNGFSLTLGIQRENEDVVFYIHKMNWPMICFTHRPDMFERGRFTAEQLAKFKYATVDSTNK